MKLSELAGRLPQLRVEGDGAYEGAMQAPLSGVTFDSRRVGPGDLFVALVGARSDGHDYLERAVEQGASAVLVERGRSLPELGCPVLSAVDTRAVLGEVAAEIYGHPSREMRVIGVTGTNGKTTTSYLLEAAFAAAGGAPVGVIGTVEYRWGEHREPAPNTTPESAELQRMLRRMRDDGVETVVMEVSSHGLTTHRVVGTAFDVGVFTNLTQDHLDFHGSMEEYRAAKASLFTEALPKSRHAGKAPVAVINLDDPSGASMAESAREAGLSVVTFGRQPGADLVARQVSTGIEGSRFELVTEQATLEVATELMGAFNVSNLLAAFATGIACGLEAEALAPALRAPRGAPGRLQRIDEAPCPTFVDYAHSPDALERVLTTLRAARGEASERGGRLIVAFGAGGDRDRGKRPQMGEVAGRLADVVVLTSDNPRHEEPAAILADIEAGLAGADLPRCEDLPTRGRGLWIEVDRQRALERIMALARPEDVVLVAGKGHETYQEIGGTRRPFDDVDVLSGAARARRDG